MYIYVQTGISVVIAIQALYTMYIILDMFSSPGTPSITKYLHMEFAFTNLNCKTQVIYAQTQGLSFAGKGRIPFVKVN